MLSLSLALWLVSRIILISAYTLSAVLSGILQSKTAQAFGDAAPKEAGYSTINPGNHLEIFPLFCLTLLGFAWPPAVAFNPYGIQGRHRTFKLGALFASGPLYYALIAFLAFAGSLYCFGPVMSTNLSILMHHAITNPLILQTAMDIMPGSSSLSIIAVLFLAAIVNLSIVMSTLSIIYHIFRFIFWVGFERDYWYTKYANYLVLAPILVLILVRPFLHQVLFSGIIRSAPIIQTILGV